MDQFFVYTDECTDYLPQEVFAWDENARRALVGIYGVLHNVFWVDERFDIHLPKPLLYDGCR